MEVIKREIYTQTEALLKTQELLLSRKAELSAFLKKPFKNYIFIGSGSSYMLSSGAAKLFTCRTDKKAVGLAAGEIMMNPDLYKDLFSDSLVVAISRSGETSEVIYAIRELKKLTDFQVLGILANETCTLKDMVDVSILIPWAHDDSICQTRNISNFYYALNMLYAFYAGDEELEQCFADYFKEQPAYLESITPNCVEIAKKGWNNVTVLADGVVSGVTCEGALAFTEISILPAEYSNLLDYRHGPIVLVNSEKLVIVLLNPTEEEHQKNMVADLKSRGGYVITLGMKDQTVWGSDYHICLENVKRYETWGVPFVNLCQVLAFHKALANDHDPDVPVGLNAFVKL